MPLGCAPTTFDAVSRCPGGDGVAYPGIVSLVQPATTWVRRLTPIARYGSFVLPVFARPGEHTCVKGVAQRVTGMPRDRLSHISASHKGSRREEERVIV